LSDRECGWQRSAFKRCKLVWGAAGLGQARSIRLHRPIFLEPVQRLAKNLRGSDMGRHDDSIMHPLSFPPCRYDPRAPQVGQMPGNLRLGAAEYLHEIADANFLFPHQIEKPKPCVVSQRLEKPLDVKVSLGRHVSNIFALTDVC
jgi:hypothetical protein